MLRGSQPAGTNLLKILCNEYHFSTHWLFLSEKLSSLHDAFYNEGIFQESFRTMRSRSLS
jgi:hypothetical protein